jgi:hypothetical protein
VAIVQFSVRQLISPSPRITLNLFRAKFRGSLCWLLEKTKDPAAVKLGRKGGKVIAKRGPEYFRQLQARRKKRKGGRPPKSKES